MSDANGGIAVESGSEAPHRIPIHHSDRRRSTTFKKGMTWLYTKAKRPARATHIGPSFVILAAVVYGVLYFGLGSAFLPGHAAWCTLLLWVAAMIGSLIAHYVFFPHVIGMLVAGILMRNLPWSAVDAFPSSWGKQMSAAALATIFLRCGLELDFGTMRRFKGPATRLALIPGLAEAFFDGGIASVIFDMPVLLGFCLGFILKAVGPGLVVPAMFKLQKTGLGKDEGIPSTVVIAASFDDIVAITGFAIFSSLAIKGEGNMAWHIAEGPLQVVFGIVGGVIAGVVMGFTKMFDTKTKRLVGTYGSCLLIMFFLGHYDMKAGGALGALTVGLIASNAWEKGFPRFASLGPSFEFSPALERAMNIIWVWIMEPMLFVTIGASINFDTLDTGTIPKSLIIIFSGLCVRAIMTFLAMTGFGYNWKERVFFAFAWTPKATVQAALSSTPLAMIKSMISPSNPDYDEWVKWGNDILTTGVFTIIVCGTLGVMAIFFTSNLLLKQSEESQPPSGPLEKQAGEAAAPAVRADVDASGLGLPGDLIPPRPPSAGGIRRPGSGQSNYAPAGDMHAVTEEDYELIAEYIDAIRHLTAAASADPPDREEVRWLSDMVLHIQQRIEEEVGRREPSVRELFRTASVLASQRAHPRPPASALQLTSRGSGPSTSQQLQLQPGASKELQPRRPASAADQV